MDDVEQRPEQEVAPPEGWDREPHPWRRYGARIIDVELFSVLVLGLAGVLIGFYAPDPIYFWVIEEARWKDLLVYSPLSWIIGAIAVAMLLRWAGTTPGKFIFGLRVVPADDRPLTFRRLARREALLLVWGIAFAIPLLSFIAAVASFVRLQDGRQSFWDEETGLIVEGRHLTGLTLVGVTAGGLLVAGLILWGLVERIVSMVPQ